MFPRPFPLILLLKACWKQGKALGSEDKALERTQAAYLLRSIEICYLSFLMIVLV